MAREMDLLTEERRARLDDEMVSLPVAATVAYFHITDAAKQVGSQADLAEIVGLVAIALSTVAPIHAKDGPCSAARLRELLYNDRRPNVDGLTIRRGDLRTAMISLREARASFGP